MFCECGIQFISSVTGFGGVGGHALQVIVGAVVAAADKSLALENLTIRCLELTKEHCR